jgi:hypothetical protein
MIDHAEAPAHCCRIDADVIHHACVRTVCGGGSDEAGTAGGSAALGAHVVAADRALGPLQPAFSGAEQAANPFTMGKSGEMRTTRIPMPPPPQLTLPALPALPLSER